jgi:hypothetical protein
MSSWNTCAAVGLIVKDQLDHVLWYHTTFQVCKNIGKIITYRWYSRPAVVENVKKKHFNGRIWSQNTNLPTCTHRNKKYRPCTYNVTLRRFRLTIVAVEKQ